MLHKTKGIVLRSIKYGETSLVVTLFTELFGVQTYMVNGVRTAKKTSSKANLLQPGAILDLVVYHSDQKSMQRIREFSWAVLYKTVLSDVIKNSIALYMVEVLYKCLKQPEQNAPLFYFCEDVLLSLDNADKAVTANMPLYFALQLPQFFGFKINDDYSVQTPVLDLAEGSFVAEAPANANYIEGDEAKLTSQLLKAQQPFELSGFLLHHTVRRNLLKRYHEYYSLHVPDFGEVKTMAVMAEVL